MTERLLLFNWLTFRLILPFTLLAACIFRFNLFSLLYGFFFLLTPLARSPNAYTIRRHTGALIWALTAVSGLLMLAQIGFQIALAVRKPYGHEFPNCSLNENITRQVGLYRLDSPRFNHVARLVLPDIVVFLVSVILAVLAYRMHSAGADAPSNADDQLRPHREARPGLLRLCTELVILVFVLAAGIISPSLISSLYFLCFLFMGTFWACLGNAEKLFVKYVRYGLLVLCAAHMAVLFIYQMDYIQEVLDKDSFPSRLVGLLALIRVDCNEPRDLRYHTTQWYKFVNPAILIVLYYLLASHIRQWKGYSRIRNPFTQYRVRSRILVGSSVSGSGGGVESVIVTNQPVDHTFSIWDEDLALLHPSAQRPVSFNAAREQVTIEALPPSPHSETSMHHYRIRMVLQYLGRVFVKQSYIISLIAMMSWSVIYHSWMTFVFLLCAIFLWLMPSSRAFCLRLSPLYTLYAEILLMAQFVFSLDIEKEINSVESRSYVDFKAIGFDRSPNPVFDLAIRSLFTFFFWTTLRLFMRERQALQQVSEENGYGVNLDDVTQTNASIASPASDYALLDPGTHNWLRLVGRSVRILMIKFWIVLCGAMLLLISMQGKVVIYRIVYMALLLCFVVMLQVSYTVWRKMLYVFWVTVIFYSMVVLLLIYTYQFKHFPEYWQNFTRLSPETLADFGLEKYVETDKGALVLGLLTPTAFLILCILQLHYFHKHFLHITSKQDGQYKLPSIQIESQPADMAKPSGFFLRCLQFLYKWGHLLLEFCWRLLEIHILKVCLFTIFLAAVVDVSAINLIFILLVAISLMAYNGVAVVAQSSSGIAAVLVIVKMIYQLRMLKEEAFTANCTWANASNFNRTDNDWVGFRKVPDIAHELRVYISVILIVTLRAIIVQRHRYFAESVPVNQLPKPGIVFPGIERKDADVGLVMCMQYLWNYGFYRFGLEICFVTMVINMCTRLDVFAVMYGILLLVMFMLSRRALARIWGVYVVVLGLLLPLQYLLVLGIPRGLCITYPWDRLELTKIFTPELIQWLYLPDAFSPPKASILIGDFFQLLFACCQWRVFNLEAVYASEQYEGGSNENIIRSGTYRKIYENPVPDFMTYTTSYLDVIKVFTFNFMYWVTLAVVFIAGTSRISLLCFVYLLGCFFFLWHGNEFFRKPIKRIMRQWNIFLTGNVLIILLKVVLQVVGCVHLAGLQTSNCIVVQLFGIACLRFQTGGGFGPAKTTSTVLPGGDKAVPAAGGIDLPGTCTATPGDAGLVLDAVVFVFLLLQKRIFSSWYFQWVVLEHKVQAALASRGAELINGQVQDYTNQQKEDEAKVMEKIKRKVERIRDRQRRFKGSLPPTLPVIVPIEVLGTPQDPNFEEHYQTTRSGDYYMFEDSDEEEDDINLAPSRPPEEEQDPQNGDHAPTGPDPLQMLNYAVMMDNIKNVVHDIKAVSDRNESERGSEFASPQQRNSLLHLNQRRNTLSSERSRLPSVGLDSAALPGSSAPQFPTVHLSPVQSLNNLHDHDDMPLHTTLPRSISDTDAVLLAHALDDIPDAPSNANLFADTGEEPASTVWEKAYHMTIFVQLFITRSIDELNVKLNRVSKDFRFVADKLRTEKRRMKRFYNQKVREFFDREGRVVAVPEADPEEVDAAIEGVEKVALGKPGLRSQRSELTLELPGRNEEEFHQQHNVLMRFAIAGYFALMARSELLSYFMIILLQMTSATVLSLPLPLMLLLWGSLTIPRPTRAFWVAIITYTMFIIIVKYFFQFPFIPEAWPPGATNFDDPLYPPRILGVERTSHYASFDLALLLVVFFHRSVLKSLGLWRSAREEKEEQKKEVAENPDETATGSHHAAEVVFTPDVEVKELRLGEPTKSSLSDLPFYRRWILKGQRYIQLVTNYTSRLNTNVYSYLFLCDFICFMIVVACYWAFGPDAGGKDNIKDYFEENRVPTAFLVILIIQFCLMILDRALYLRKNLKGKLIFQLLLVLTVHGAFFFYLPKETGKKFINSWPLQIWYFVKCVYFMLSAYQIRSGYPTRILGNFLTYRYTYTNLYLFKGFIIIPFLMELRSLMDWIWTDTSMSMSEWLKLEDIYANIFVLKCWRMAEVRYPTPRGTRYMTFWKYLIGGSILLLIILVIWFPLVLFSLTNAVGVPNEPQECAVEVSLGGHQTLYKVTARQERLANFSQEAYDRLLSDFSHPTADNHLRDPAQVKQAAGFINQYGRQDIWLVSLEADSSAAWTISPPAENSIIDYLTNAAADSVKMIFKWTFSFKQRRGKLQQVVSGYSDTTLSPASRTLLAQIIARNDSSPAPMPLSAFVTYLYPRYIRVPSVGWSSAIGVLQPDGETNYRNASVQLKRERWPQGGNYSSEVQWWNLRDPAYNATTGVLPSGQFMALVAFIDKVFPQAWSVITGYGIVGLYISLVFVIGRLVRLWSSGMSYRIMFDDLPEVDRILRLCLDIFLVRENREYRLEEDLYAKLIFLYRSPETMFKWTKLKRR